ncbi:MAG: M20/M25/M40 family metallo-hydrolase [Phycisphaeraceae bacterium]|nr:M20/M25/M40 family metallo-hydrolase [Phycisphaeraceae bacterium]
MASDAPMPRGAWIVGALGAIVLAAALLWHHQPRSPMASKELLTELLGDGSPHPVGSEAGAAFAARVAEALRDTGAAVEIQDDMIAGPGGAPLRIINVLGRIHGTSNGPATLLTAHHDSVAAGPGAADDGAGVVSVIEAARKLAREGTNRDVIFLLTDGEEVGLFGAITFALGHPWFDEVGSVVNLDARGSSGPCHIFQIGYGQRALVEILRDSVPRPVASSVANEVYRNMGNDTDFTIYLKAGLPGFNLAFIGDVQHYHQPSDTPENLHAGSLAHMQETALALVRALDRADPIPSKRPGGVDELRRRFAEGDPRAVSQLRRGDFKAPVDPTAQSFASFAQRWVLTFDVGLVPWFAGATGVLLLFALTVAWWRGLLGCVAFLGAIGRLLLLVSAIGGATAIVALGMGVVGWREGSGWVGGIWPVPAWPWFAALWTVAFVTGVALWQLVPARSAWANVAAGVSLVAALLISISLLIPATAAMLLPPVVISAIGLLLGATLPLVAAGISAMLVASVALWAMVAVVIPLEPSLIDAIGFGAGPAVVAWRPLLVVAVFCILLRGATRRGVPSEPAADARTSSAPAPLPLAASSSSLAPLPIEAPLALEAPIPSEAPLPVDDDPRPKRDRSEWRP